MSAARNRLVWLLGRHASSRVAEVTADEILDMHAAEIAHRLKSHTGALNGKTWQELAVSLIFPRGK